MVRSIAGALILALLLGSGRLLACDWECGDAVTAPAEVACHHESPDSRAALIGGVAHECLQDAIEPVVTAAQKGEKPISGAVHAPSLSTAGAPLSTARLVSRPLDYRVSVAHPVLTRVLRI